MTSLYTESRTLAQWPTAERVRALKRILPHAKVQAVLRRTGHASRRYLRLPAWFMVWFVVALGLFCRDCYRQVFKWLQPFRRKPTPGRSTFCEARQRLGVAPLNLLIQEVVELRGTRQTPGAFYHGMRLMALDGFVLDVAAPPQQRPRLRATGLAPQSGRLSPSSGFGLVRAGYACAVADAHQALPPQRGDDGPLPAAMPPE
ncbi:hypothetical protein C1280_08700 [Gemmata obscuriglobus]|uniref:Transposase IS4 N-terminal domain-containing protein n=1 Tax=Gemmata obscuriglobus TaxID=114 RepID=A0A2Z3H0J3_9BACT|nr:hypothetical protein C1280_08700 [Gemmata obscuriglobus]